MKIRTFMCVALGVMVCTAAHASAARLITHSRAPRGDWLLTPAPHAPNRAIVVDRERPLGPAYRVASPLASRRSLATGHYRQPGPAYYGASDRALDYACVRVDSRVVCVDVYQKIPHHLPQIYRDGQRVWLKEHGYIERARVVTKPRPVESAVLQVQRVEKRESNAELTPRATIRIDRAVAPRGGGDQRI
jgi:hypothetical protein